MAKKLTHKTGLYWKVNTPGLLEEILVNNETRFLKVPINIFQNILGQVAERAIKINDPELNLLMCRLALYEQANPYSKDYDKDIFEKLEKQIKKDGK